MAALGICLFVVLVAILYFLSKPTALNRPPEPGEIETGEEFAAQPESPSAEPVQALPADPEFPTVVYLPPLPDPQGGDPIIPPLPLQAGELAWEKRLKEILADPGIDDTAKAKRLLDLLPVFPVEGREEAAEEAMARLSDADYRHAQNILVNPATFGLALRVMWTDLMDRPETISLPILLQIARNPQHPFAPQALENLDLLMDAHYGEDWARWDAAIRDKNKASSVAPP
jgi:hypothetical protein